MQKKYFSCKIFTVLHQHKKINQKLVNASQLLLKTFESSNAIDSHTTFQNEKYFLNIKLADHDDHHQDDHDYDDHHHNYHHQADHDHNDHHEADLDYHRPNYHHKADQHNDHNDYHEADLVLKLILLRAPMLRLLASVNSLL